MHSFKYSKTSNSQIQTILRLAHVLRQLDLSNKWCWKVETRSEYAYMGEDQVIEFYYNYFALHNRGKHD